VTSADDSDEGKLVDYDEAFAHLVGSPIGKRRRLLAGYLKQLEDDILLLSSYPDDAFAFVLRLLSHAETASLEPLSNLVLMLNVEFHMLSADQRALLLDTFRSCAPLCQTEMAEWVMGDLVARQYDPAVALSLFRSWASSANGRVRYMAFFGCDVLRIQTSLPVDARSQAVELMNSISL
jgi:hypothetical protein